MKKIIFLDHDGVMCLYDESGGRFKKWKENPEMSGVFKDGRIRMNVNQIKTIPIGIRFDSFNQKAVKVLNRILEKTDAEIVVTSDWRHHTTLEEMQELYKLYGVIKSPIGLTPFAKDLENGFEYAFMPDRYRLEIARCAEVNHWLSENPKSKWVAVDDLDLSFDTWENWKFGLKNFVHTPRLLEGIKQSGKAEKVIKFLTD